MAMCFTLTEASLHRFDPPSKIVVMGVSGCGKTTVGMALAARLQAVFIDGDDLHLASNIAKMSRGARQIRRGRQLSYRVAPRRRSSTGRDRMAAWWAR